MDCVLFCLAICSLATACHADHDGHHADHDCHDYKYVTRPERGGFLLHQVLAWNRSMLGADPTGPEVLGSVTAPFLLVVQHHAVVTA